MLVLPTSMARSMFAARVRGVGCSRKGRAMRRRMRAALAVGALAMACGGKTSGTADGATVSIEGSIGGESVAATDAVGLYSVASEYGDTRVATGVLVSNR